MIHVIVPGAPVPQPRHRTFVAKKGKMAGRAIQVAAEKDHPIWAWRDRIAQEIRRLWRDGSEEAFAHPVVAARLVYPRAGKPLKTKANPTRAGGGRGDLDNLIKPFLDVGNDLGIWPDDGRVWLIAGVVKREASGDNPNDRPRAEFTVWDASEFNLEAWVQWSIDSWPIEWSDRGPVTK